MRWRNRFPFQERVQCDFCGGREFAAVVSYDDLSVVRCSCGYIFMNPFLTEAGSQQIFSQDSGKLFPWLKNYDLLVRPDGRPANILGVYERSLQYLEKTRSGQGRILDIGCGSGHFLSLAKKKGWTVEGIDFDPKNAEFSARSFGIDIRLAGFERVSLDPGSYDVLTMWDYFEHVEHPVQILEKARLALKPNGILLIACPNHDGLLFAIARVLHSVTRGRWQKSLPMLYPPTHLSYFSPSFLAKAATARGFRVLRIECDESDLSRIDMAKWMKGLVGFVFAVARWMRRSNRFMLFLAKE